MKVWVDEQCYQAMKARRLYPDWKESPVEKEFGIDGRRIVVDPEVVRWLQAADNSTTLNGAIRKLLGLAPLEQ